MKNADGFVVRFNWKARRAAIPQREHAIAAPKGQHVVLEIFEDQTLAGLKNAAAKAFR